MAVHMFRCVIGRGPMAVPDLETRIDDWVASNAEWVDDPAEHTLTERNTEPDGSGVTYHGIDVRFLQDDAKDNILQKFTDKLKDKVDWYRVGYHVCPHDETDDLQPVDGESWTATVGSFVQLANDRIATDSVSVTEGETEYVEGDGYEVDEDRGRLKALESGGLVDGETYTVKYDHYASGGPCYWPLDEPTEWTAKDVTIPTDISTIEVTV